MVDIDIDKMFLNLMMHKSLGNVLVGMSYICAIRTLRWHDGNHKYVVNGDVGTGT